MKKKGEDSEIPIVGIDYGYLKEGYIKEERGQGTGKPILVIKDGKSKWLAAHMVPKERVGKHMP